ncbi:2-succinylbenzoate--CoA ligase [Crocosphaera chwakensis]|uniref:O-succinylbenzoic acid--CoA ligase n=1 Tax=Crocosphaera chwakensis CCY0110 TaxID=391612 RepID=A3IN24_9CHRO|nr:2-succinylbenzoate--CoA ligase [Crocosphaera chwakensis]EAZ92001.1 O-succinylbenzoic acid--CoA ligase [Crocosphaera chwakensis CCY0110]
MNYILETIKNRLHQEWIIGCNSKYFYQLIQSYLEQLTELKIKINKPRIIIVQKDDNYIGFLAAFLASIISNCHVFLCDKRWKEKEWKQVLNIVQPHLIIGIELDYSIKNYQTDSVLLHQSLIMIPTGGTSGNIRFAIHTWETLSASVQGFGEFFDTKNINSFCILPLHHVSGLMQFIRSFITQGKIMVYPYSHLKKDILPSLNLEDFFISLVPTQLQLLLNLNPKFLSQFKTILLGGAPPWNSLLTKARDYKLNLSPTYGMTETASQIVTLKPENFLQGNNSTGQILPHAHITINQEKIIKIQAKSLYFGYYPNHENKQYLITDDLGYFDYKNYLHILGRNSQKIITGGENVFPKEVENVILETHLVKDIAIIGMPNEQWGEVVTAIYVPQDEKCDLNVIKDAIKQQLSPIKQPKHWIEVKQLPRNQQGKLNYQTLQKIASTYPRQENYL